LHMQFVMSLSKIFLYPTDTGFFIVNIVLVSYPTDKYDARTKSASVLVEMDYIFAL